MDIFKLAMLELKREGLLNSARQYELMLERAVTIRHYLDIQERNKKVADARWAKAKKDVALV